jgi:ferric-dicitrate binding protein FerR (iron transport regulator)
MKYTDYSARDFIQDEYFQHWVFHPDEGVNSFWRSWLTQHPEKRPDVDEARRLLMAVQFERYALTPVELTSLWHRISQAEPGNQPGTPRMSRAYRYAGIAAAVVCMAMSFFFVTQSRKPWQEYTTPYGETLHIELPDGSSLMLNANSTLTLKDRWNDTRPREVWIDGEAFFDVRHTGNDQAFIVHTAQGVSVEVLGTTFNVYDRTNETKVVLNTGQIRLNLPMDSPGETITMKPGEMVEYKAQEYRKREVNPSLYTAWTTNKIILDHTSLADMIQMLKDTYGLHVELSDKALLRETVSGSMPLGDAEALLQQMAMAYRLKITRDDKRVVVEQSKLE